jgi:hypothetical protein
MRLATRTLEQARRSPSWLLHAPPRLSIAESVRAITEQDRADFLRTVSEGDCASC